MTVPQPKMYAELADWWPILSTPESYREEAVHFRKMLEDACERPPRNVLELGCGGGNNASFLKRWFRMTLTDLSPGMVEVSRKLNPECDHAVGDMRTIRLDREFDAVFAHDAIVYMLTDEDLRAAFETAFVHCRPGGAALFIPDHVEESFEPRTGHGGHDTEGRCMRYLEWETRGEGSTTITDYAFLLREADGSMRVVHDRHVCGLFPRDTWVDLLGETGFEVEVVPEPYDRVCFVAKKPLQTM